MIYRPDEESGPGPDTRTNREIVSGLLAMAFLLAVLTWYTSDLWCDAAPWLCLDSLKPVAETMPTATPTAPGSGRFGALPPASTRAAESGAPLFPAPSASPDLGLAAPAVAPTFEFAPLPGSPPGFTPPPTFDFGAAGIAIATPTVPVALSPRRAQMTATAAAAATFEPAPRGSTPGQPTSSASATGTAGDPYPSVPASSTSTPPPTNTSGPYP